MEGNNTELPNTSSKSSGGMPTYAKIGLGLTAAAISLGACKGKSNNDELHTDDEPNQYSSVIPEDMDTQTETEAQGLYTVEERLVHTEYWTTETDEERKPNPSNIPIIAGHTVMNEDGYSTLFLHINNKGRTQADLSGSFFNGYTGELTEENIEQITKEIEESVRANEENFVIGETIIVDGVEEERNQDAIFIDYWTIGSEVMPDLSQFDIISCHNDPDDNGNAKVTFLVRGSNPITKDQLVNKYFNGFEGVFTNGAKDQIITDLHNSIRPHVPGFNLTEIEVIHLP